MIIEQADFLWLSNTQPVDGSEGRVPTEAEVDEIVRLLEESHEQIRLTPQRIQAMREAAAAAPAEQREELLLAHRLEITRLINEPWVRAHDLMQQHDASAISGNERITGLIQEIRRSDGSAIEGEIWGDGQMLITPRPSTSKIEIPWESGTLYPAPNLHGHGTRNLGRATSGDVEWTADPNGGSSMLALVGNHAVARVDLTPGREGDALREILTQVVSPRALKTMIGISRLVWEKTDHQPLNKITTVTLGELARATGYEPGPDRNVKAEIRHRLGRELRALCSIATWAADGPYDRKTKSRSTSWVAPLLVIPAVHLEQITSSGGSIAVEIDVMLGRNWATAYSETDLVQFAPGFMKLHDDNVLRLGWYYQTEFRYHMIDSHVSFKRSIHSICTDAAIDPGDSTHRGRFLDRFEKWHAELLKSGVIGAYERDPKVRTDVAPIAPSEIFARGEYTVRPPDSILEAYAATRAARVKVPESKARRSVRRVTTPS